MAVYTNNTRVAHTAYRMAAHLHEQPRKMRTLSRNVDVDYFIISKNVVKIYPCCKNIPMLPKSPEVQNANFAF